MKIEKNSKTWDIVDDWIQDNTPLEDPVLKSVEQLEDNIFKADIKSVSDSYYGRCKTVYLKYITVNDEIMIIKEIDYEQEQNESTRR